MLNIFEQLLTKTAQKTISENIIAEVKNGNTSALEMQVKLKFIADTIKDSQDGIKEDVLSEVNKFAKGQEIAKLGARIEPMEAGIKYNYESCGHPRYAVLKKELKDLEEFLKALKQKTVMVDEDTGDIITLYPPLKTSTSTVKVTLSK